MRIFGTEPGRLRGCFAAFDIDVQGSEGAVLRLPENSTIKTLPRREKDGPLNYGMLVTKISLEQRELVNFLRCFGGRVYTYAFGADLGDLVVQFVGFMAGGVEKTLGNGKNATQFTDSTVVSDFLSAYGQSRVSVSRKLATISLGGRSLSGFIIGMKSSTMRTEANIQTFTMIMKLVSVQGYAVDADTVKEVQIGGPSTHSTGDGTEESFGLQVMREAEKARVAVLAQNYSSREKGLP